MVFNVVNLKNGKHTWSAVDGTLKQANQVMDDAAPAAADKVLDLSLIETLTLLVVFAAGAAVTAIHLVVKGTNDLAETDPDAFYQDTVPAESSGNVTWNPETHIIPVPAGHAGRYNVLLDIKGLRRIVIMAKDVGGTGSVLSIEAVGSVAVGR